MPRQPVAAAVATVAAAATVKYLLLIKLVEL